MTGIELVSGYLHTAIGLLLLTLLCFYFWRGYRIDALREELFKLRGELFDYAASGAISFDDPAYTRLRMYANSLIRFAHRFTVTRFILLIAYREIAKFPTPKTLIDLNEAISGVPDEQREKLKSIHNRMVSRIVWHLFTGSIVIIPICYVVAFLRLLWVGKENVGAILEHRQLLETELRRGHRTARIVEAHAISAEIEEEEAHEEMNAVPA